MAGTRIVAAILCAWTFLISGCSQAGSQTRASSTGNAERGSAIVVAYGCVACHEIPDAPVAGKVGPPLKGVSDRAYIAGYLPNTPENLTRWIRNPKELHEHTVMPNMSVTDKDAWDIAAFLYTLH